jgi:type II secretory pathway pseudopilin PulG
MKKYIPLLVVVVLIGIAAIFFFFFYRMGSNDAKALADFSAAYKDYDQSISDFSTAVLASNPGGAPATDDLERKANEALVKLTTKASARISSLTKNDGDLMRLTLEIADLSGKELDALKAYQSAVVAKSGDADKLANEFADLKNQRQTAYARYLELAGLKN